MKQVMNYQDLLDSEGGMLNPRSTTPLKELSGQSILEYQNKTRQIQKENEEMQGQIELLKQKVIEQKQKLDKTLQTNLALEEKIIFKE